jgi:hypothetical protein
LFGLRVASEIELPELFEAGFDAGDGLVDVTIVRGAVAAAGPDAVDGVVVAGDGATLEVPDVARRGRRRPMSGCSCSARRRRS